MKIRLFSVTGQVRFDGVRFTVRKEGVTGMSVRNVGTSGAIFSTKGRARAEYGIGIGGITEEFGCN